MKHHANISVFVPHLGCSHQCSFCNQKGITGQAFIPHAADIDKAVETAKASKNFDPLNTELAFFGGSFTAINREYMCELLSAAARYVKSGDVSGIRLSTRPDAIDSEVLTLLKNSGVTAIELGAQSMNDDVLSLNRRGHKAGDVVNASRLIKEFGFELGLQMMTGLYGSDDKSDLETADEIIKLAPHTVRIYPTIVIKNTELERLYLRGEYKPQTLENAVSLCSKLLSRFESNHIKVIRLGLHTVDDNSFVAGPLHPALRELCEGEMLLNKVLVKLGTPGNYIIYVSPRSVSKMIGQKKRNISALLQKGFNCTVAPDDSINGMDVEIKRMDIR